MVLGILAHVDAGKTTLSEALLYETGKIRALGRVDHQDAYLDTDTQERERGITIFSKQAQLELDIEKYISKNGCSLEKGNFTKSEHSSSNKNKAINIEEIEISKIKITLLDTPGHVDFSAEMERTLQVLDYAVLVISGTDGVQGHTKTLWRLLKHYQIPTFLFINKMDLDGANQEKIQKQLKSMLSDGCVDFTEVCTAKHNDNFRVSDVGQEVDRAYQAENVLLGEDNFYEEIAMCSDALLDRYMENGSLSVEEIRGAIEKRLVYPCFYGSALKVEGIQDFLIGLGIFARGEYEKSVMLEQDFGALVYKISRDPRGVRLTHLKVTSGVLRVKDKISYNGIEEKADQLRIYSGDKFELAEQVQVGEICAVTGLDQTYAGMGLGVNTTKTLPILEPVLNYQILVPQGVNPVELMKNLKQLEEEDPQLNILWNEQLQEIHAQLMGQVQMEVLGRLILERFGVKVAFGPGNIVYKETIAKPVEGVGHFEPLRHYAEAHLWMEPGEPGSGITVFSNCSEDVLDLNWQRLITTHILEREHVGVLTGSGITDIKFTIVTGRAHLKHTEGGDFRQATYRAIRQGLKSTECVLLEPIYAFTLEVPVDAIGRAMTDIRNRFGKHETPEYISREDGDVAVLTGTAPVATMQDYMTEVHAYTKGMGQLTLELKGYDVCHNSAEVVERIGYDSEEDLANPTGSVFCAHGAGFVVPWNEVPAYMHMEYVCDATGEVRQQGGLSYDLEQQAESLRELAERREAEKQEQVARASSWEMDKELQQIYAREFGMNKEDMLDAERKKWAKKAEKKESAPHQKLDKKGNSIYPKRPILEECLIVDGYNIIFAIQELKELSRINIDSAKDKLKDILADYQGYTNSRMILVFDGYRKKGNLGSVEKYFGVEVVHTKQDETADAYIERTVHEIVGKYKVTVATNDSLEQLTILSQGALRMSAGMLMEEIQRVKRLAKSCL